MNVHSFLDTNIQHRYDWTAKGLAPAWDGCTAREIGATALRLFDDQLLLPAAILKRSVMDRNRAWMRRFLTLTAAKLAPHGKTTLSPELFQLQIEDGAWAITAATAHHVRVYRRFGVARIFMANQLIGAGNIAFVADEMHRDRDFEFYCLVDSVAGVEHLHDALARRPLQRPMQVLVEVGRSGGRCGVRSIDEGLAVARAVGARRSHLALVGIETFEGIGQSAPNAPARAQLMLDSVVALAEACAGEELFATSQILLSAGGSAFFDLAAATLARSALRERAQVVLRSGCYITHDDGLYARLFSELRERVRNVDTLGPGLAGALQVWAHVQSMPEPGRMICALGRRDIGADSGQPQPLAWARRGDRAERALPAGFAVADLYDQHAILTTPPAHDVQIGDMLGFGVSHPCTTFDKWRTILVVDDEYVVRDVVRTYF